jgi:rhodanese-related sulfurtransferase
MQSRNRTVVTYCTDTACKSSTIAAEKLEKFGFKNVLEYKAGIEDWKRAGYPTEK